MKVTSEMWRIIYEYCSTQYIFNYSRYVIDSDITSWYINSGGDIWAKEDGNPYPIIYFKCNDRKVAEDILNYTKYVQLLFI